MTIFKYTRVQATEYHNTDPELEYSGTTIEQTKFGSGLEYLSYVEGDFSNLPEAYSFIEMTDQETINWCNENIGSKEGEEFTISEGRIVDNRILDV